MFMKKIIIFLSMLLLCGCSNREYGAREMEYVDIKEYSRIQAEEIIECVVRKDKEGLKSVFSKHISETHNLDKEIDEFFEFIDGEIVSYDTPEGSMGGGRKRDGEYVERTTGGQIENIITSTGNKYMISFMTYYICEENKDKEGVSVLGVVDANSYKGEIPYQTYDEYVVGEQ